MDTQWIKYLSPVAILGIIWSIVQFYQKRKFERIELRRKEKLESFKVLQKNLNNIRYLIIDHQSRVIQTSRYLNNQLTIFKEDTEVDLKKSKIIDQSFQRSPAQDEITDTKKHEIYNEQENLIKILENRLEESQEFLKDELKELKKHLSELAEKITQGTTELNLVPLPGLIDFRDKILELTNILKRITSSITIDEATVIKGYLSDEFKENITKTLKKIESIELLIFEQLK